jgi:hypothetical protein
MRSTLILLFTFAIQAAPTDSLVIPPTRLSLTIEHQAVAITTSGTVRRVNQTDNLYAVALSADLSDFQQNLTAILKPQLDRSDKCGDHLDLQNATLVPQAPSGLATVQVHYERWGCVKAFGKQIVKKLVAGNGTVLVKLTPVLEDNAVHITAQTGEIQADGSLGEVLRSGELGATLREKIQKSVQSAIDKSTDWKATVPATLRDLVTLRKIEFRDAGGGRIALGQRRGPYSGFAATNTRWTIAIETGATGSLKRSFWTDQGSPHRRFKSDRIKKCCDV